MSKEEDGVSTTTGATDAQIEAAVERWPNDQKHTKRDIVRQVVCDYAADLVPPGMVIASAADVAKVPTAEELNAMQRVMSRAQDWSYGTDQDAAVVDGYLARVMSANAPVVTLDAEWDRVTG